jgi:hypothetical protein
MPNVARNKTRSQICFARYHMTPATESFYRYALAVSRPDLTGTTKRKGIFYSDDRRDSEQFRLNRGGISTKTVYAFRQELERDGWFVRLDKGKKQPRDPKTGFYKPIRYEVLTHDEWSTKHPHLCFLRAPLTATESLSEQPSVESTDGDDTGRRKWIPRAVDSTAKSVVKQEDRKRDDDDSNFCPPQQKRLRRAEGLSPKLRAWMESHILARANGQVHNPSAFTLAAEGNFIHDLPSEVHRYLRDIAAQYLKTAVLEKQQQADDSPIPWAPILTLLDHEARQHDLPVNREDLRRALRAASKLCGLVEKEMPKELAK